MPVAEITSHTEFCAAHRLYREDWSPERNEEVYGPCATEHGHNYTIEVTVRGPVDPETGMVLNLVELERFVHEEVFEPCDHKHLNHHVPFLKGVIPTAENLAVACWRLLARRLAPLPGVELVRVRIQETPTNTVEFTGEGLD